MNQEIEVEAFKLPLVIFFHFLQYCIFKISKLTFNIPKVKSHFRLKPTDFFFFFKLYFSGELYSFLQNITNENHNKISNCLFLHIKQMLTQYNSIKATILEFYNLWGVKKLNQFEKKNSNS